MKMFKIIFLVATLASFSAIAQPFGDDDFDDIQVTPAKRAREGEEQVNQAPNRRAKLRVAGARHRAGLHAPRGRLNRVFEMVAEHEPAVAVAALVPMVAAAPVPFIAATPRVLIAPAAMPVPAPAAKAEDDEESDKEQAFPADFGNWAPQIGALVAALPLFAPCRRINPLGRFCGRDI